MAIFQYKCTDCLSVFDHLLDKSNHLPSCVSCSSLSVERNFDTAFFPNKLFCPHERDLKNENLALNLIEMAKSRDSVELQCGEGKCGSSLKKSSCSGSCARCS